MKKNWHFIESFIDTYVLCIHEHCGQRKRKLERGSNERERGVNKDRSGRIDKREREKWKLQ